MFTESMHNHTTRCGHATDSERMYIENAIQNGMKVLGFADHAPYIFDPPYKSGLRMAPEKAEDYVKTILDLKREYKNDIEIHLGFEAEYYPRYFERFLKFIGQFPIEYLLLGQHAVGEETDGIWSVRETHDDNVLKKYVDQTLEGLATGAFCCFAHPDVINYKGNDDLYKSEMHRLCAGAKRLGIPLEVNMLGIRTNRNYPNPEFWRIAGLEGCTAVCGGDAHAANDVYDGESYKTAEVLSAKYGFKLNGALSILKDGKVK